MSIILAGMVLRVGDPGSRCPRLIDLKATMDLDKTLRYFQAQQYHTALIFLHRDGVEQSVPVSRAAAIPCCPFCIIYRRSRTVLPVSFAIFAEMKDA